MRSNEPGSQKHAKLLTYSSFFLKSYRVPLIALGSRQRRFSFLVSSAPLQESGRADEQTGGTNRRAGVAEINHEDASDIERGHT